MSQEDDLDNFLYGEETQVIQIQDQPVIAELNSAMFPDAADDDASDDIDIVLEPRENDALVTLKTTENVEKSEPVLVNLDLNAPALYDGKPITEIPISTFEDRPWCLPGADITDYFNYGFNEDTWSLYCERQRTMRGKNNLQYGQNVRKPQKPWPKPFKKQVPHTGELPAGVRMREEKEEKDRKKKRSRSRSKESDRKRRRRERTPSSQDEERREKSHHRDRNRERSRDRSRRHDRSRERDRDRDRDRNRERRRRD